MFVVSAMFPQSTIVGWQCVCVGSAAVAESNTLPFAPGEAHTGTPHSASEGTETPEEGAHQAKADT